MLYDPKWEQKPDRVFGKVSLLAFITWLEQQPSNERYYFCSPTGCAVARHLQALGYSERDSIIDFPDDIGGPAYWLEQIVNDTPMTFGAALERARAAYSKGE